MASQKKEKNWLKQNEGKNRIYLKAPHYPLKYPHLQDEQLQQKIALKQEFFPTKYDGTLKPIRKTDNPCETEDFSLAPHQEFVKTYISRHSPYNGLLLYHGMGSGKTCSVIGICEEYRKYNKHNKDFKKILIIASPNVQDNFKLQLFNKDGLHKKKDIWQLDGCVGESLLQEMKFFDIQSLKKEDIELKLQKQIRKYYEFMGYVEFANKINKVVQKSMVWKKTYNNNRELINEEGNQNSSGNYAKDNIEGQKYNDVRRKTYKSSVISGYEITRYSLTIQKKMMKHLFANKMIVVDEAHNIRSIDDSSTTSSKKVSEAFQTLLKQVRYMKLLFLSGTPMYNDPLEILFLINLLNKNDGQSLLRKRDIFDKEGNFKQNGKRELLLKCNGYVSYVRGENPYQFPFKIMPNEYESTKSIKSIAYPRRQFNDKVIQIGIDHLDVYYNTMSPEQKEGYDFILQSKINLLKTKTSKQYENADSFQYTILQEPLNALTLCMKETIDEEPHYICGKPLLDRIASYNNQSNQFHYNEENQESGSIFNYDNIGNYSAKIKSILDHISNSTGIVLIYSQFLDAGLIPIALALEEMGYRRNSATKRRPRNILQKISSGSPVGYYAMICGEPKYSTSNKEELRLLNSVDNKYGNKCKVVLISQAGSEGLDFKNLRQVHILEPWYNLNRIDQIIGRAIRNCSHKDLPLKERNCQIFLHATYGETDVEYVDMMMYRLAEKKAKKIGEVQKVLKSISVDCLLNKNQQNFKDFQQTLDIVLSSTKEKYKIKYEIKDKNYSSICDYGLCEYTCHQSLDEENMIDKQTYSMEHMINQTIIKQIKKLFRKQHVFKKKELMDILTSTKVTSEHVYYALQYLVENEHEILIDKFGRKGHLINIKDLYLFQTNETNTVLSLHDIEREFQKKIPYVLQDIPFGETNNNGETNTNIESPKNKVVDMTSTSKIKIPNQPSMNTPEPIPVLKITSVSSIIQQMIYNYKTTYIEEPLDPKEKDYYVMFRYTLNMFLSLYPIQNIEMFYDDFIISHMIEELSIKEEKKIINYLFSSKHILNNFEKKLKHYYKERLWVVDGHTLLFLVDVTKAPKKKSKEDTMIRDHIVIMIQDKDVWKEMAKSERNRIGEMNIELWLKKLHTRTQNDVYGFIDFYDKESIYSLKTVGKKSNGKGAIFIQKNPKIMRSQLCELLGNTTIFTEKNKFTRHQLLFLMETLLKYFHLSKKDNKMYYYNKLEYASMNLKN